MFDWLSNTNRGKDYNDLFHSFGIAIAACTLLVSIGKYMFVNYFFNIIIGLTLVLVIVTCYHHFVYNPKAQEYRRKQKYSVMVSKKSTVLAPSPKKVDGPRVKPLYYCTYTNYTNKNVRNYFKFSKAAKARWKTLGGKESRGRKISAWKDANGNLVERGTTKGNNTKPNTLERLIAEEHRRQVTTVKKYTYMSTNEPSTSLLHGSAEVRETLRSSSTSSSDYEESRNSVIKQDKKRWVRCHSCLPYRKIRKKMSSDYSSE